MAIKFGVNLATPNPGGRDGSIATQKTNISSSLFTMCREWHAALLLSLSCWLGLSTLGPYGPLRYRDPLAAEAPRGAQQREAQQLEGESTGDTACTSILE